MKNQRTKFVENLSAEMVEWDVQIDRLRDKAEAANAEMKFEYYQNIDTLQLKRDQAAKQLQGIGTASDEEWEEMKDGANQIWDEIKTLVKKAIRKTD